MQEGMDHAVSVRLMDLLQELTAPLVDRLNDGVLQAKHQVNMTAHSILL